VLRRVIIVYLVLILGGCAGPGFTWLHDLTEQPPPVATEQEQDAQVQRFQNLLEQGWELYVYEDRLVLVRYTKDGKFEMKDVFNTLEMRR
jgi:hypothetical protein